MTIKHARAHAIAQNKKPTQFSVVFFQAVTAEEREHYTQDCLQAMEYLAQHHGNDARIAYRVEWSDRAVQEVNTGRTL